MDFRFDVIIEDGKVFQSFIWRIHPDEGHALFGEIPPKLDSKSALVPMLSTPTGDIFVQVTRIL
jgi:hypothetical protein